MHGHAMTLEVNQHAQAVEEQLRLVEQRQAFLGNAAKLARLIHPGHLHTGRVQLARHQHQQGPGARDQRRPLGLDDATFDLQLQATQHDHPWRGPARKRHAAFMATGAQQQLIETDLLQLLMLVQHLQALLSLPADHAMVEAYIHQVGNGRKFAVQFLQRRLVALAQVVEFNTVTQRPAVNHTAQARRFFKQGALYAMLRQLYRRRQARRATPDNHRTRAHSTSSWLATRLIPVSTCMPGLTTVWQARRLCLPSIFTRQQ